MHKKVPPITTKTTMENAKKWLNIIRFGESGTVIQLQDDCEYRVLEIINNRKILKSILGLYYRKYLLKYIPIDLKDLHKAIKDALIELCVERRIDTEKKLAKLANKKILSKIAKKGYEVGLFISHISPLLIKRNLQPLIDLELLIRTSKNLSVIVFSEVDITCDRYHLLADKCSFLFDHFLIYPMYGEKDAKQFIAHYNYHWRFSLSKKTIGQITHACGGYLWLIHQAQRTLRDNPTFTIQQALSSELMIKKLEVIWTKFIKKEKNIIRKVYFENIQELDTLTHEYKYLKSIRVIKEINGKTKLGIPLLSQIIEKENRLNKFQVRNNYIFIGEKEITSNLSRKERAFLYLLLSSKRKIVSRDKVAQTIWGKDWEEKYSDWAIDRLVYRIRKKFKTLGMDKNLLKTAKKKGFVFG